MANSKVAQAHDAKSVRALLNLPEIRQFIADLDELHWTGRPGFGSAVLVGAALVKAVYCLPTWSRTARLIAEHDALRDAVGGAPSQWACYRFAARLRDHGDMLTACIEAVLVRLRDAKPEMGKTIAIDGSNLPAYANGQKYLKRGGPERKKFSDPTRHGATAHRSAPVLVADITVTRFTAPWTRLPDSRSRGRCGRPRTRSKPRFPACSMRSPGAASRWTSPCSTRAMTQRSSTAR